MFFNSDSYSKMFTEMISEGFIVIDSESKIQVYNNKAKEIFGIQFEEEINHHKGKIEKGDIVVLVDNALGKDDGKLDYKSLEVLGIEDRNIKEGDAIIAIGLYRDDRIKPIYKILDGSEKCDNFNLNTGIFGINIGCSIDFINKIMNIRIEELEYKIDYNNAFGHMVLLDKTSKEMKFCQAQGYTARSESINDILKGKEYRAKGQNTESFHVIGVNIGEIHKSDSVIEKMIAIAKGKDISYVDEFEEINGIPTICTLLPLKKDDKILGAALKVEDITELKRIMMERDNAISKLEKAESLLFEEKTLNKAFPNFVGDSNQIEYVKKMALKASKSNSNVLILGESGTGKSILARAIHNNSKLKDKAFIDVNCSAIPEALLESELFGYEKGAFTGARNEGKKGFFEIANGGTIFLDEIGDISSNLQAKLLQVIQEKSFYPVGGTKKITVDIRTIVATNKNLEDEISAGRFREDLYYRINVFPIWIPALRDRKQDINQLVELFLPKICEHMGCKTKAISSEAMNLILKYNWPGNIRELENILERAVNLSEGNNILSKHIKIRADKQMEVNKREILPLKDIIDKMEKEAIENAILYFDGNKKKAMEALKISKTTFYEKLKKYKN